MSDSEKLLTIFVLPSKGNGDFDDVVRLVTSLPDDLCVFLRVPPKRPYTLPRPSTKWWGFMYGNEWFDESLAEAMPIYMRYVSANCIIVFKKVKIAGELRYFSEPRFFKTDAVGAQIPPDLVEVPITKALDGFVLEDDREGVCPCSPSRQE